MKASELKKQLDFILRDGKDNLEDDFEIVVEVQENWVGPTPAIGILRADAGFDWDSGRIILKPIFPLSLNNPEILKTHNLRGELR